MDPFTMSAAEDISFTCAYLEKWAAFGGILLEISSVEALETGNLERKGQIQGSNH